MRLHWVAGLLTLLVLVRPAVAAELVPVDPAALGFDAAKLARIDAQVSEDVDAGTVPGAVVAIVRRDRLAYLKAFGRLGPDGAAVMAPDSLFRIYSMTKPVTSVAVMQLVEAGRLALDDPVYAHLPAFREVRVRQDGADVPAVRPITIADLLRHTSGLTYGFFGQGAVRQMYRQARINDFSRSNEEFVAAIAQLPLEHQPGTVWEYSHATDVLGRVVEVVSGRPLDDYLEAEIFAPLGMTETGFYGPWVEAARLAQPPAGTGLHDATVEARLHSGGGGLVSTVHDYLRFARMLHNGGELDGVRVIGAETLALMRRDHIAGIPRGLWDGPGPGYGFGYGFAVRLNKDGALYPGNLGDVWWGGYAGTYFWLDPVADLIVVHMMQAPGKRRAYRPLLRRLVYDAMVD